MGFTHRHLYEDVTVNRDNITFCFINPILIGHYVGRQATTDPSNDLKEAMNLRIQLEKVAKKKQVTKLFLMPYCTGSHWVVVVANPLHPDGPRIYYIDSSKQADLDNRKDLRRMINT